MIEVIQMAMYPSEEFCRDAALLPNKPVPLSEETGQHLYRLERRLMGEITSVGPDTLEAEALWEKVFRLQIMSGVVVAAMVGGSSAAREAADYLMAPPRIASLEEEPQNAEALDDAFERMINRAAS